MACECIVQDLLALSRRCSIAAQAELELSYIARAREIVTRDQSGLPADESLYGTMPGYFPLTGYVTEMNREQKEAREQGKTRCRQDCWAILPGTLAEGRVPCPFCDGVSMAGTQLVPVV